MNNKVSGASGRVMAVGRLCLLGLVVQVMMTLGGLAQSIQVVTSHKTPKLMDRQKEMALALSACPSSVADKAAVYVLESFSSTLPEGSGVACAGKVAGRNQEIRS